MCSFLSQNIKVQKCNMTTYIFKNMKALVKTIAFLIFWTCIIYEGDIYLFIILKKICESIFTTKDFKMPTCFWGIWAIRLRTTKFDNFMVFGGHK
jgi:hypothetical protein